MTLVLNTGHKPSRKLPLEVEMEQRAQSGNGGGNEYLFFG